MKIILCERCQKKLEGSLRCPNCGFRNILKPDEEEVMKYFNKAAEIRRKSIKKS